MKDHANSSKREYIKVNSELTLKLAKTALKAGVRTFIYASSVKVMGEGAPKMEPLTEEAPFSPENSYAMSKMEAEKELAKLFGKQTDSRVVIFRLPMVYGPGNKGNMLALLKMASRGIPLPLGALKAKRSMIYIGNLCDAIRKVIEDDKKSRPSVQTYFINDGDDISSRELYAMISREYSGKDGLFYLQPSIIRFIGIVGSMLEKGTGLKLQVNREVVSKLINEYRFSAAAFCQDYDWSPPHTVHDGIKATVEWHRNNSGIGGPA
jgi:nucleoside-diphosphate-sugar epimerase